MKTFSAVCQWLPRLTPPRARLGSFFPSPCERFKSERATETCCKIMSHKSLVSIALLLGILAQGRAAEYFVRPIVSRVDPHVMADSRATGLGFCAGVYWRTSQDDLEKEISVEFDRAKWSGSESDGFNLYNVSETMMPIVLNLRVNVCPDSDLKRLRFYIGPCFGVCLLYTSLSPRDRT